MTRRLLPAAAGRPLAGILDAGVSSLGNFAVSVGAARALALDSFGVFSLAVLGGFLSIGLSRSLHGDKLVLLHAASLAADRRRAAASAVAACLLVSACLGGGVIVVGFLTLAGEEYLSTVVALGAVIPALCVQDFYRSLAYAQGRPSGAVVNSGTWTLTLLVGLLMLAALEREPSAADFVVLWGTTALLGALAGAVWSAVTPAWRRSLDWYTTRPELGARLVADFVLLQATAEGSMLLIAALTGPEGIGSLRKAQLPLAAITVLTTGLVAVLQPTFVRYAAGRHSSRLTRAAWAWAAAAFLLALLIGAVVWFLPAWSVEPVVGDGWPAARNLLPAMTVYLGLGAFAAVFGIAVRARNRLRQQVAVRVVAAPAILLSIGFAAQLGGVESAAWALVVSTLVLSAAWVTLLHRPPVRVEVRE